MNLLQKKYPYQEAEEFIKRDVDRSGLVKIFIDDSIG